MKLLHLLRERRVAPYLGGYAAGGWIVLEVVDQFVDRGVLPELLYPLVLAIFLCGFPGAFVVAWFHGARGDQKAPRIERWLLACVALLALGVSGFVVRARLGADEPTTPLESLRPWEDPRRLAVLYFEGRPSGGEAELLAQGLTESLIDELSAVEALYVVSRNGVASFRGTSPRPDSVGHALEVGTLVQGRVTQADSLIRVNVEVLNAADGSQIESTDLQRPRSELFALQEELAQEVAFFLRERIGQEVALIERQAGADNVDAWVLVRKADELAEEAQRLTDLDDLPNARRRFLEADSVFAAAAELAPGWAEPVTRRGWIAYRRSRLLGMERSPENSALLDEAMGHAN
ncbi:MAG: hypothetical protein ACRELC_03445, partial [Gemmatimonadota bacterium]